MASDIQMVNECGRLLKERAPFYVTTPSTATRSPSPCEQGEASFGRGAFLYRPLPLCTSCRGCASQPKLALSLPIKALSFCLADRVRGPSPAPLGSVSLDSQSSIDSLRIQFPCHRKQGEARFMEWRGPPRPLGSVSLDSQVALLPYESSSFATL